MAKDASKFSAATIETLEARAGYRCSYPGCGRKTGGPSRESSSAVSKSGMACHIVARAKSGSARRVVPGATPAQKSHISNGIWMCYTHGKLIDTDEFTYTIDQLKKWRDLAEAVALFEHSTGTYPNPDDVQAFGLGLADAVLTLSIPHADENRSVAHLLVEGGVSLSWGERVSDAIRDFCIEYARNARDYGGAGVVAIEVKDNVVKLKDDGAFFDLWTLPSRPDASNGTLALNVLLDEFQSEVVVSSGRDGSSNYVTITLIDEVNKNPCVVPCAARIELRSFLGSCSTSDLHDVSSRLENCTSAVIILPDFLVGSDLAFFSSRSSPFVELLRRGVRLTLIAPGMSEWVLPKLQQQFPTARVVRIKAPRPDLGILHGVLP